jgi:uroporphyrinogen-III synthase
VSAPGRTGKVKTRLAASPSLKRAAGTPKPLSGVRVLVGRARHQASALSSGLRQLGARVIEVPFIEIRRPRSFRPLDDALRAIRDYEWLVLTSVNGVQALWQRLNKLRIGPATLRHLRIAAIGPATKKAIESHGRRVHVVPQEYVAESVVRSLRDRVPGKRVLLVRARVARDVIPRELRRAGARVDVAEAYETVLPRESRRRIQGLLKNSPPHVITFTSSSTARNFAALAGRFSRETLKRVKLASIGPVTSGTLRELGLRVDIEAREYTIPGLTNAIVLYMSSQ